MFVVLYQRGQHLDEGVRWFHTEDGAIEFANQIRLQGQAHWYCVAERRDPIKWGHLRMAYDIVTEWGVRK